MDCMEHIHTHWTCVRTWVCELYTQTRWMKPIYERISRICACSYACVWWESKVKKKKTTNTHQHKIVYPDVKIHLHSSKTLKRSEVDFGTKTKYKRDREKEQQHISSYIGRFSWNSASRWITLFFIHSPGVHTVVLLFSVHIVCNNFVFNQWSDRRRIKKNTHEQENVNI